MGADAARCASHPEKERSVDLSWQGASVVGCPICEPHVKPPGARGVGQQEKHRDPSLDPGQVLATRSSGLAVDHGKYSRDELGSYFSSYTTLTSRHDGRCNRNDLSRVAPAPAPAADAPRQPRSASAQPADQPRRAAGRASAGCARRCAGRGARRSARWLLCAAWRPAPRSRRAGRPGEAPWRLTGR